MNLLSYTKKLSDQIKFYDILTKNNMFNSGVKNPFNRLQQEPVNLTIIWIDDDKSDF